MEREKDVVSVTKSWTSWTLFLICEGRELRRRESGYIHVGSFHIQLARQFAVLDPLVYEVGERHLSKTP